MFLVSCIIYITEGRNRFLLFLYVEVNFTVLLSCFFEHKTFQSLTFYLKITHLYFLILSIMVFILIPGIQISALQFFCASYTKIQDIPNYHTKYA